MTRSVVQNSVSGYQIEVTSKKVRQAFQHRLTDAKIKVTVDQWVLLQALDRKDGISQLELAKAVFKDQPSVTRIIDLLVQKKLITRNPDSTDRRKFSIVLTKEGKSVVAKIKPLVLDFRKQVFAGIPSQELDQFQRTLSTIFNNLQ